MGLAANAPVPAASMDAAAHHIRIEDLTFDYGGARPAVDRLSFGIRKGEFLGLLGPSGCGKSTTLRMIAGLMAPTSGRILIGGQDIVARPPWERNLGLVFQSYALFPHMTVAQNVAFGLKQRRVPRAEIRDRVAEALRVVRLDQMADRVPSALSGGQQQRVAIARAIVVEPEILLLDEPLSNLDARLRDEMRFEIRDIQTRTGITTLFVTHDQHEALTMCDRIAVMNVGELEQIGTPTEIYDQPASRFVANFIGRANELACSVDDTGALVCNGRRLPGRTTGVSPQPGSTVVAAIRPHAITLGEAAAGHLAGTVQRRVFVGNIIEVALALPDGQTVTVELRPGGAGDALAVPGAEVGLTWRPETMRVFAA
ncbi:putative spermidine/putrescine transport system ATP-binding protein [Gemmobacter megaterium]|uniref:Putative spermidine/putrescine transport system ATP-binding protein n=1 Tax=Gemmobacter megaterium TaxID=1086013 RepID=A0A1N7N8M0_9RHOB|nr:ABC transporter ATP-binding protein [Gemmobacter megaterium]GGE13594.1 ABC transporter ATP-binding protein [Gemmobacter megaterium]SIS94666.1 putative spermidine/putrescine transport system ATP-binding protein [Gemmobacter megaterium]